jgi:hypothetical protein
LGWDRSVAIRASPPTALRAGRRRHGRHFGDPTHLIGLDGAGLDADDAPCCPQTAAAGRGSGRRNDAVSGGAIPLHAFAAAEPVPRAPEKSFRRRYARRILAGDYSWSGRIAMIPELKHLARYLVVMTLLVAALGTFLRLATRCDPSVLRSLNIGRIVQCAMLRAEEFKH